MKSDEVEPVCGLYTKLRIRSEKYRPDHAKIDLRLKQLRFFSVHPGMRSAPFVKPGPIKSALPAQGGRGPGGGIGKRVARVLPVPTATRVTARVLEGPGSRHRANTTAFLLD